MIWRELDKIWDWVTIGRSILYVSKTKTGLLCRCLNQFSFHNFPPRIHIYFCCPQVAHLVYTLFGSSLAIECRRGVWIPVCLRSRFYFKNWSFGFIWGFWGNGPPPSPNETFLTQFWHIVACFLLYFFHWLDKMKPFGQFGAPLDPLPPQMKPKIQFLKQKTAPYFPIHILLRVVKIIQFAYTFHTLPRKREKHSRNALGKRLHMHWYNEKAWEVS